MMQRVMLALVLGSPLAWAGDGVQAGAAVGSTPAVKVSGAWVRAMPPVAKNSAGYVVIENRGDAGDVLVGARIDTVRVTELHEMVRNGDTLAMRHRKEIALPAHATVTLAPGGLHLMLIDLQQPLQAGGKLGGVLRFRDAGDVAVTFDVRGQ